MASFAVDMYLGGYLGFLEGNAKTDVVGFIPAGAEVAEGGLAVERQAAPAAAANDPAAILFLAEQRDGTAG